MSEFISIRPDSFSPPFYQTRCPVPGLHAAPESPLAELPSAPATSGITGGPNDQEAQVKPARAPFQDGKITFPLQRPIRFQAREDVFSGLTVRSASDEARYSRDFQETFALDSGHIALVLGDVTGHGPDSVTCLTELKDKIRLCIHGQEEPVCILVQMNKFLCESNRLFDEGIDSEGGESSVSLSLVIIDQMTGAGALSIAGMEGSIIVRVNGTAEALDVIGTPFGVVKDAEYEQVEFWLDEGDTLVLCTDGITEARQGRNFLGVEGLLRLAITESGGSLQVMADTILDGARSFSGGTPRDDASLVLVRRTPICVPAPNSIANDSDEFSREGA